jgi:hypothetical protein
MVLEIIAWIVLIVFASAMLYALFLDFKESKGSGCVSVITICFAILLLIIWALDTVMT